MVDYEEEIMVSIFATYIVIIIIITFAFILRLRS